MHENSTASILKWDCLVLTARNAEQCKIFYLQLAQLRLVEREFCRELIVLPDTPDGVRIGSGGATLNAFLHLEQRFGPEFLQHSRVLLLHSGGLSQRIPHVALTGKAFMLMPDGRTLLEHKLRVYRNLLNGLSSSFSSFHKNVIAKMPGFVFIASADVLEFFPSDKTYYSNSTIKNFIQSFFVSSIQLLLVAHQSPLDVATQHGVFVIGEGKGKEQDLVQILQKPSESQLRQMAGAILPNNELAEMVLTDSCFLINQNLVIELLRLRKKFDPLHCELCCYRDFLCPLGSANDEEKKAHFCMNDRELFKWQQTIWDLMNTKKAALLQLGPESFFHFGTPNELLNHFLQPNSAFRRKFLDENGLSNLLISRVENEEMISQQSLLEWCKFQGECRVEDGCILSGLELDGNEGIEANYCPKKGKSQICILSGTLACTIPININEEAENLNEENKEKAAKIAYVTVLFHREDDLKKAATPQIQAGDKEEYILRWFGHQIVVDCGDKTLWECPLFEARRTASESLFATLRAIEKAPSSHSPQHSLMSISTMFKRANVREMLRQRQKLLRNVQQQLFAK